MLTPTEILNRIDEIVERAYTNFSFNIIGEDFLTEEQKIQAQSLGLIIGRRPLIEVLYQLARQRSTEGYKQDKTLNQLIKEISERGVLPQLNDEARYTVEHAKASTNQSIDEAKNKLKSDIKKQVLRSNLDHKDDLSMETFATIPQRQEKIQENTSNLLRNLTMGAVGLGVVSAFNKEFTTQMTNIINSAAVDAVRQKATQDNQVPGDAIVYKQVINDNRLSPECRRLHTHGDGSPRLYTLEYVQANGSNVGKPKSDWNVVISGTHPNCRCSLRAANPKQVEDYLESGKKINGPRS